MQYPSVDVGVFDVMEKLRRLLGLRPRNDLVVECLHVGLTVLWPLKGEANRFFCDIQGTLGDRYPPVV